jgi:hypothetical protein
MLYFTHIYAFHGLCVPETRYSAKIQFISHIGQQFFTFVRNSLTDLIEAT